MDKQLREKTEAFVKQRLEYDTSGHDWHHIDRVRKLALYLAEEEQKGDRLIVELAALLHDIPDDKLSDDGSLALAGYLKKSGLEEGQQQAIQEVIAAVSFSSGRFPASVEAEIVQDADRLDAIGAIGIARTFAYGGHKGQPMYDPALSAREEMDKDEYRNGKSSSIHHFYEKLLKLAEGMNTPAAKKAAKVRHQYMLGFLEQFYKEWDVRL